MLLRYQGKKTMFIVTDLQSDEWKAHLDGAYLETHGFLGMTISSNVQLVWLIVG